MKNLMKRLATALLTVVMALGFVVPSFAENVETGSLTVTGGGLSKDKKVYAVEMFAARVNSTTTTEPDSTTTYDFDSYELLDEWLPFFRDSTDGVGMTAINDVVENDLTASSSDQDWKNAAREYVQSFTEGATGDIASFAHKAEMWVRTHSGEEAAFAGKIKTATAATSGDTVTAKFESLPVGYYLVYPEGGTTGDSNRGTAAMLVNVPRDGNAEWNMKSTFPTVDKKVDVDNEGSGEAADNSSAQVGDTVTYTLTSAVPDMRDYDTYYFAFKDTLSEGLTFVANSVVVKVGDTTLATGDTDYDLTVTAPTTGNNVLTVVITDLKEVPDVAAGQAITVTYKATINENAVNANDDPFGTASNKVELEYSNDPESDGRGTSTPDETKVYTYPIEIVKYFVSDTEQGGFVAIDDSWDGNHDMELDSLQQKNSRQKYEYYLSDATFVLSTSQTTPVKTDGNYGTDVVKLKGSVDSGLTVDPSGSVTEFTTKEAAVVIKGLEAGTYYLHEITAPEGYNKLTKPVEIQIVVAPVEGNAATNSASYENPVYIINGVANTAKDNDIKIENKKGIELPETGSIGTIGLTALGVLVIAVGVLAPRRKKSHQD